jgi:hypothetical protein
MRRPPLAFDASSSKALVQSSVTVGKLESSRVTASGVLGLVHDSVTKNAAGDMPAKRTVLTMQSLNSPIRIAVLTHPLEHNRQEI